MTEMFEKPVKTTFCPQLFKMRFSQKNLLRFVEAQNTKKSWMNICDKIHNGGVNQDGGFQLSYF
jgi:hypothetical protein